MLPHPILASDDDEDYVRRSILRMPYLVEEFFSLLERVYLEGKMAHTARAHVVYYTIQSTLDVLLSVPSSSYVRKKPLCGKDIELSQRLERMGRLFLDEIVVVGPQALTWKKPVTGLAQEAAQHMMQTRIKFPLSASLVRHGVSYDSVYFPVYIILFVVVILFGIVALVVIPVVNPPRIVAVILGGVASFLLLLGGAIAIYFYIMTAKSLYSLYTRQMRERMISCSSTGQPYEEREDSKLYHSGNNSRVRCGENTKVGFYTIPYGENLGYIDGRQVDAQVVMIGFDHNYFITKWNNAAEAMTGFLEVGCIGKPLSELVITPTGDIASDLEELRRSREKVMKVKLRAFATAPVTLFTIVAPITNPLGNSIGNILICANAKDNLGEYRSYIRNYLTAEVNDLLTMMLERNLVTTEGVTAVQCLQSFVACAFDTQLEDLAREMMSEWEWTTADQILRHVLSSSKLKHAQVVESPFPATLCLHPKVSQAIASTLAAIRVLCTITLRMRNLSGSTCSLVVVISSKNQNDGDSLTALPSLEELRNIVQSYLRSTCGNILCEGQSIAFHFPCQMVAALEDVEDVNINRRSEQSIIDRTLAIVNCTVNVLTLITNLVDQHNISMILLKTMFVSLTSVHDQHDLEQRLRSPSDVDVIVCDRGWLSSARDLILSTDHGAIVIPIVEPGVPFVSDNFKYVIHSPFVGSDVRSILMDVGTAVSLKKNAITAREEKERILTLRQDSPWTKGKMLGRGAFGAVHEATSDLTGGKMAVKMFYFSSDKESSINKLLNEVRIMCSLNHPNVVHYFHCERKDNNVNLFMELCDASLSDIIIGRKPKPLNLTVVQVMRQILTALTYLHARGIAHRDVKPQNILLKGDTVKLTDFGTARVGQANRDVQGTLRYMAPEVYKGEAHSTSCDIWSMGCLACELFTCPRAFMENPALLGEMPSATSYMEDATSSVTLMDFLRKCFQCDPEQRPTAADLLLHPLFLPAYSVEVEQLPTIFQSGLKKKRWSFSITTQNP